MPATTVKRPVRLSLASRLNLGLYHLVFNALAMIKPASPSPLRLGSQSRVLVFSSAGLGDSLLDSVAIRALAETYPGIHLAAVVHHRRPDISEHNPLLSKLYRLRKGPPGFLRLWRALHADGPWHAVLYLSCHDPEARCLGYLLNRHATAGITWRSQFSNLCAINVDEPGLKRAHLSEQALRVAAAVGAKTQTPRMVYTVTQGDRIALDARLKELRLPSEPMVTLQLGGGGAGYRDWPVEHFIALAKALHQENIGPLFILGGPDHRAKADRFAAAAREAGIPFADVVGKLKLPLSAALLERSRCLVSTDTGIMHLGFALQTPTVALLHCSPGPARVGPLADLERHAIVALTKPPGYKKPSDASMKDILPEQVLPRVQELLYRHNATA